MEAEVPGCKLSIQFAIVFSILLTVNVSFYNF